MPGHLILICGMTGSGKTTLAKRLQAERPAVRLNPDDWMTALAVNLHDEPSRARVEALQWQFGKDLLAAGMTVIVEWGTWGRGERNWLREDAHALGATTELHYLSAPADVLFERIRQRNIEDPPITREALDRWLTIFQPPIEAEFGLFDIVHRHDFNP